MFAQFCNVAGFSTPTTGRKGREQGMCFKTNTRQVEEGGPSEDRLDRHAPHRAVGRRVRDGTGRGGGGKHGLVLG